MPAYPAAGGTRRLFISHTIKFSTAAITTLLGGGEEWKWIDISQYTASGGVPDGTSDPEGGDDRWVAPFGTGTDTDGHLRFAVAAGGAGSWLSDDGVNTPINIEDYPNQWFWVCFVSQEGDTRADTWMKIYLKLPGAPGVITTVVRDGLFEYGPEWLGHKGRGWYAGDKSVGGYFFSTGWDADGSETWTMGHLFIGDFWRNPPAGI
jgi:hypothetical protein